MKKILNDHLKQQLINTNHFNDLFSTDMSAKTQLLSVPAGGYIIENTKRPAYLFYLVRGKAKLYDAQSNGKTVLIDFFTPPCFMGEMELLDPDSDPFSMQAIEDCLLLALPINQYQNQLLSDTIFLRHICLYLAYKEARDVRTASKNQSFTLNQRLAAFILLTEHNGTYNEKHTQVAQYLGVSYRHLLYVLATFVDQGYLVKHGRHVYQIANREKLMALSSEIRNEPE
ncbi:transcriptional regulator YeiL [Secundilactobacillus hailunensis]|uniref:Transcriptional regulator YeiL n=1 Tax=Secundilactobacillus hailunensis TaxID=2559923 RepID=A0ABW1T7S4_9LACO|nr:transcriptional regulator YeiL [Secundilactobacillus hailunensis]